MSGSLNEQMQMKNTFLQFGNIRTPSIEQFASKLKRSNTCPFPPGKEVEEDSDNPIVAMGEKLAEQIRLLSVEEENPDMISPTESAKPMRSNVKGLVLESCEISTPDLAKQELFPDPEMVPMSPAPKVSTDEKTTMMLRNIPNKYNQSSLLEVLDSKGFNREYDFFYLPVDFKNGCNMGYAFINFVSDSAARRFESIFKGLQLPAVKSSKVCDVSAARVQGLLKNIEHYRNSPINDLSDDSFKPALFDCTSGNRLAFPRPDLTARRGAPRLAPPSPGVHLTPTYLSGCTRKESGGSQPDRREDTQFKKKIFIGGIGTDTMDEDMRRYFSYFGRVEEAWIARDKRTGFSRGFGFCTFSSCETAERVLKEGEHVVNGHSLGVRLYQGK